MKIKVEESMSKDIVAALWSETLDSAYKKMQTLGCRHLPVINDAGDLIGIISDRDLQRGMCVPEDEIAGQFPQAEFPPEAIVARFMSSPVTSIEKRESIAKAARLMIEEKISALIVIDKKDMVGIITHEDLLKVLIANLEAEAHPVANLAARFGLETPIGTVSHLLSQAGL